MQDTTQADAQAITARIEQQVRQAQEHASRMRAWAEHVEQITGEGSALRSGVRVSVNHSGVLQSLRLSEAALGAGPEALARAILTAVEQAKQAVADETAGTAVEHFGRDGEVTRLMVADLSKRLGVTADLGGGPGRGPRPGGPGGVLG